MRTINNDVAFFVFNKTKFQATLSNKAVQEFSIEMNFDNNQILI